MGYKNATVYIVRHGETVGNDTKLLMHPDEDVLNAAGKAQAANLGKSLSNVPFTQLYVSNYPRTIETGSIILSHNLESLPPPKSIDKRLREIGIENLYGKSYANAFRALIIFLSSGRPIEEFSIEGSEPIPDVRKRAKEFLLDMINDICSSPEPQTILTVSHGAFIRFFLEQFTDCTKYILEGWNPAALNITRNTGLNLFELWVPDEAEPDERIIVKFKKIHDFSHFPKEMLDNDSLTRLVATPEGKCLSGCFQV